MNWLRVKLRKWVLEDLEKRQDVAIRALEYIEAKGAARIKEEMEPMFFTFTGKQVPVKIAMLELMRFLGVYLTVEKYGKDELAPIIKQIRKPAPKKKILTKVKE